MLQERPDDKSHWKKKLDLLDHLPAEPMADKQAKWEKLYHRLDNNPRNKKFPGTWLAAASILVFLLITFYLSNQPTTHIVTNEIINPEKDTLTSAKVRPLESQELIKDLPHIEQNSPELANYTKPEKNSSRRNKVIAHNKISVELPVPFKDSLLTAGFVAPNPDSNVAATVIPVKKKLRLIHINQLDKPADEKIPFARNYPVFQNKPFNQDVYSNTSGRSNTSDLLKIKLSPSN